MARIAGVDLPRDKRLDIALTYIYGIGPTKAIETCVGLEGRSRHQGPRSDRRRGRSHP